MRMLAAGGLIALSWLAIDAAAAPTSVGLGTAESFAVLAGSTVTNTGTTTVNGNLGVSPGTAITGFPPGKVIGGTIHAADAVAAQAQTDLTTAYNVAAGETPPMSVSGDLGGLTLTSGVYKSASSLGLTGALTLDAQGNPNAVFVFQIATTLITAVGSRVILINGAQPCNVIWQVGSSATLGTSSIFVGNILALMSITLNHGVTVAGRTLARNGAVTLDADSITAAHCATGGTTGTTTATTGTTTATTGTTTATTGTTTATTGTTTATTGTTTATTTGTTTATTTGTTGTTTATTGTTGITTGITTGTTGTTTTTTGVPSTTTGATTGPPAAPGPQNGMVISTTVPRAVANSVAQFGTSRCVHGSFLAVVTGLMIRRVVFSLGPRVIADRSTDPFEARLMGSTGGIHVLTARVTFTDSTPPALLSMRIRACAGTHHSVQSISQRPRHRSGFTG